MPMEFDKLLITGVERGASDLHLKANTPVILRIHGRLVPQGDLGVITAEDMDAIARRCLSERMYAQLKDGREVDSAYSVPNFGRFRVNMFLALGAVLLLAVLHPANGPFAIGSDVEGIPQGLVKPCTAHLVQPAYRLGIEDILRNGEDIVAVHDAGLGKALWLPDLDFGPDASDCSSDRGTGHRPEHWNCCVSRQNANGSAARRGTEISPVDVTPRYHSRAVSAARRRAASTI